MTGPTKTGTSLLETDDTMNVTPFLPLQNATPSASQPGADNAVIADWMETTDGPFIPDPYTHDNCQEGDLQSHFPCRIHARVERSGIARGVRQSQYQKCIFHQVHVDDNGYFRHAEKLEARPEMAVETWKDWFKHPSWVRTKAIFVEDMPTRMLQELGTRFEIGPWFFSPSLNRIPSCFQTDLELGVTDSITITLTFLRSVSTQEMADYRATTRPHSGHTNTPSEPITHAENMNFNKSTPVKEPLCFGTTLDLCSYGRHLCLDFLSIHIIRNVDGNIIISYHPDMGFPTTRAQNLHDRIRLAGQNIYWRRIFQQSRDPTLLLLLFLWYMIYSWDQALEHLNGYMCRLESKIIDTGRRKINHDLYVVRAHQLTYAPLLDDIRETIEFIRKHKNPAMMSAKISRHEKELSTQFLERECDNLVHEITRVMRDLTMQQQRLNNLISLVSHSLILSSSSLKKRLTGTIVRKTAVIKQIAYISTVFVPAIFVTDLFGINTRAINPGTIPPPSSFTTIALLLTIFTIWIVIAAESRYILRHRPLLQRLVWPWLLLQNWWYKRQIRHAKARQLLDRTIRDAYEEELRMNGNWV